MEVATTSRSKIALVHHWLVTMRGGERVLEALGELFPSADLFTLVYDRSKIPVALRRHQISGSLLQHFPNPTEWYRHYLPFFPIATRHLDVSGYDLIISSDAAVVKGVRGNKCATHICYCHSPMSYVWSGYETYYQAIRRSYRFGQTRAVDAHIVLTEPEEVIYTNVLRKEREAEATA